MTVTPLTGWTVTLGGIEVTAVPDPTQGGSGVGPGYTGSFETQESDLTIHKRDVPAFIRSFRSGFGVLEVKDPADNGALAWAEDGYTHFGNGLLPSLRRFAVGAGLGLGLTGMAVTDSRVFAGDLYCITSGNTVIKVVNADPTQVPTVSLTLTAGYVCKAIELFAIPAIAGVYNAGGTLTPTLFVSGYKSSTGETQIWQYNTAGGWTVPGGVLGYRADKMAVVYWEGRDGVGAQRMVIQADDITIRHCIYGNNPTITASYVTPIVVGNPYYPITKLLAAPDHLWVGKANGWHDVNELRSANVTPYWADVASFSNALAATIYDDGLLAARASGLDRYDTRLGSLIQQRLPGECGPALGSQDGHPITGQIVGLAQHDGALLMALFNAQNMTSYLGRAYDRNRLGQNDHPNPLVHYWSEQVLPPTAGVGQQITHLTVTSPSVTASPTLTDRVPYVWMFTADYPTSGGFNFNLHFARLPAGSGPLSTLVSTWLSGSPPAFNATARFYLSAQIWQDRNAQKYLRRIDLVNQLTTATNTIELRGRADGDPRSITDQTTWTSLGTTTSNITSLTPASAFPGHSIALQAVLSNPTFVAPPILQEVSLRAAVRRETFKVRYLWIVCEKDHELPSGAVDLRDEDAVFDAVVALRSLGPQAFVNESGATETVLVEQNISFSRAEVAGPWPDGSAWRTLCRLELSQTA